MASEFLVLVAKDKRLWLFCLSALLALVLGFFSLSGATAIIFVSKAGFWFILCAFVLWVVALWQSLASGRKLLAFSEIDWLSHLLVLACTLVLLVHESFGFKIIMDEIMLLGTSMSMHFDKTVLTPMRGNDIQGSFELMDGIMDKRPLFFPFLASLVHDLAGYRPSNVFFLNGILTALFLTLLNIFGGLMAGRQGGWLAVLLFTGLPLLGHNATGGGFELLNLVMIVSTLLLSARWLEKKDETSLTAMCFSAILLIQTRYESVVLAMPVFALVLWVWFRERRIILSWSVVLAPLLLIPYPLQHRIFSLRESTWELASRPGYEKPFSFGYIPENLQHAVVFFFSPPNEQPSSLVFSVLGWVAVPFALLMLSKQLQQFRALSSIEASCTAFTFGFIAHFLLMLCYFWGKFDDPVIRRLSLPEHLWLLSAILIVIPQFFRTPKSRWILVCLAAMGIFALGVPAMSLHAYSQAYLPGRETAWRRHFMAEQARRDYLMIDNDCTLWVTHQISSTPVLQAKRRREALIFHTKNHTFANIFVFQRLNVDPETGKLSLREGDDLGSEFSLETVKEERLQYLTISRISRVVGIKQGDTLIRADTLKKDTELSKDPKEVEKQRRAYLENFVKQLP